MFVCFISSKQNEDDDQDFSDVMNDPAFLRSVLEGLPGVDPQSAAIRSAVGQLTTNKTDDPKKEDKKKDEKKKEDPSK